MLSEPGERSRVLYCCCDCLRRKCFKTVDAVGYTYAVGDAVIDAPTDESLTT